MNISTFIGSTILFILVMSCNSKKEQINNKGIANVDSVKLTKVSSVNRLDVFSGEYLIGDESVFIVPDNDKYLLKNENGEWEETLFFIGKEKDSLLFYANEDKTILFNMSPGHKAGIYIELDEQRPVTFIKPLQQEETEEEETDRIFKQRYLDDSIAFAQLDMYNGSYFLNTESEGVNASLKLVYNGNKTFNYEWNYEVLNGEVNCEAHLNGVFVMDRTQHGFDDNNNCVIHFNLNGYWNNGYVVEIDVEDQAKCSFLKGECSFSGHYINSK